MAGTKRLPSRVASVSRSCSASSRNLRNMIHVSMGSLSSSPLRPLSLRMMSRADLITEASCWAVDAGTLLIALRAMRSPLRYVEQFLEFGNGGLQALRAVKPRGDLDYVA